MGAPAAASALHGKDEEPMLGNLTADEIESLLRRQQIGRLGVTDGKRVYIFPVAYGYDGASVFVVSRPGLKVQLMRGHPEVCVEIEEIETPARWRTVIAHGHYEKVTDPDERDEALALIAMQGETPTAPSLAPYLDGPEAMIVYRIRLTEKTGRFERDEVFRPAADPSPAGAVRRAFETTS
jgi:uncharacterized protein